MAMALRVFLLMGVFTTFSQATGQESVSAFNYSFAAYKKAYGRTYAQGSSEHVAREKIFHQRSAEIIAHNSAGRSWQKGFNKFTDRTEAELVAMRGFKRIHQARDDPIIGTSILQLGEEDKSCMASAMSCMDSDQSCCNGLICGSNGICQKAAAITEMKDWSFLQTSKTVLDQGSCGSCWAMAAAAVIQLTAAKNEKRFNKVLSPQSILSCTPNPKECGGQGGCRGATPGLGFEWVKRQGMSGGVLPMDQETYTASDNGASCEGPKKVSFLQLGLQKQHPALPPAVSIGGWKKVEENKALSVMNALSTNGPLAVAIVGKEIQTYNKGVIDTCNNNFVVDHAVVMMGYGNDPNHGMYWKIRNSWGPDWGEAGYLRLRRHTPKGEEPCGWDNNPEVGVVCKNDDGKYPARTWVCGECGIISDVAYPMGVHVNEALLD